jgi:hypothetical protein
VVTSRHSRDASERKKLESGMIVAQRRGPAWSKREKLPTPHHPLPSILRNP